MVAFYNDAEKKSYPITHHKDDRHQSSLFTIQSLSWLNSIAVSVFVDILAEFEKYWIIVWQILDQSLKNTESEFDKYWIISKFDEASKLVFSRYDDDVDNDHLVVDEGRKDG